MIILRNIMRIMDFGHCKIILVIPRMSKLAFSGYKNEWLGQFADHEVMNIKKINKFYEITLKEL